MTSFAKRTTDLEIMDDLACSGWVLEQTLRELEFINQWLGGNDLTIRSLKRVLKNVKDTEIHICDIGCGSGDMLRLVKKMIMKNGLTIQLSGVDANPNIIDYAKKHSLNFPEIKFFAENILEEPFRSRKFDVVLATLFLHHFTNDELVTLFRFLHRQTSSAIIVNDLHRHWFAYYSIQWLTGIFSKSSMVKNDAPLSVLRGFKKMELEGILKEAGITNYTLAWRWAFRWELLIYPNT